MCELAVPAKDWDIWEYAKKNDFIIVTNDEDFLNLVNYNGFPPKVVLLKTGNQSSLFIESLLINHKDDITALHGSTDYGSLQVY